ncbi:MAG TPA: hypothetical protein ENN81_10170, partial [Phycisphaerales bacterium]|nr:hypothetical protein [Phycisphaerales bacterium]
GSGGAIRFGEASRFHVVDSNFIGHTADIGGALRFDVNSVGQIVGSLIVNNAATEDGGAIYMLDCNAVDIVDCNIAFNAAARGGGIWAMGTQTSTITGSRINYNTAGGIAVTQGGGIYAFEGPQWIADCEINYNSAVTSGGGLYLAGDFAPVLNNCLITNNVANRDGGGVSVNWQTVASLRHCTIADNEATGAYSYGGGLYASYESVVDVNNSIIWDNNSTNGAQVALASGDVPYPLTSRLTIANTNIGPQFDPNRIIDEFPTNPYAGLLTSTDRTPLLVDAQTIYNRLDSAGRADVIVMLAAPTELFAATNWNSPVSVATLRADIDQRQDAVLATLSPAEFQIKHRYENIAGFSGSVSPAGLQKLRAHNLVRHVEPVRELQWAMAQGIPLANAVTARQMYNGSNVAVAICDSGFDYTHPMLGGGGFPNAKIIGGYDFGNNDPDPLHEGHPHGTCCAGIAAGSLGMVGDYIGGVAPGAGIYGLKISIGMGGPLTNAAVAAWDWCVTHRDDNPAKPIRVISNSWGGGGPIDDPAVADGMSPALTAAADAATAAGITVMASSGNEGFAGTGISWPAAMSKVVSVGAVHDTLDTVMSYSNAGDLLDILAPGDPLYTTDIVGAGGYNPGDYMPNFNGTSAACPFAAGCVAVM